MIATRGTARQLKEGGARRRSVIFVTFAGEGWLTGYEHSTMRAMLSAAGVAANGPDQSN